MGESFELDHFLHRVGALARFEAWKFEQLLKGHLMDPFTAAFNFFSTPAGQTIVNDIIALDKTFITLIASWISKAHAKDPGAGGKS